MTIPTSRLQLLGLVSLLLFTNSLAFSSNNGNNEKGNRLSKDNIIESSNEEVPDSLSRRNLLSLPIKIGGAVIYGKLLYSSVEKLSRGEFIFPEDHERRVRMVLSKSLVASAQSLMANPNSSGSSKEGRPTLSRPFRVLEVGIGNECRLARRGLYGEALRDLDQLGFVRDLEVTGIDLVTPNEKVLQQARDKIQSFTATKEGNLHVNLNLFKGSITSKLEDYPNGFFDSIICTLTLCSVDDQAAALKEIHRLIRPSGGTFGYLEHVAVNQDEPYKLLELQQKVFDPVQHLADNCHLHRYTDEMISKEFQLSPDNEMTTSISPPSSYLLHERFLVDDMWPISCQCCGVIQQRA